MNSSLFLAVASVFCSVTANIFCKRASHHLSVWQDFFSVDMFLCILFYALGTIVYLLLLRKVPLSTAYPLFAVTFVLVILASRLYFNEAIDPLKLAGIVCIVIGIFFIALSANRSIG